MSKDNNGKHDKLKRMDSVEELLRFHKCDYYKYENEYYFEYIDSNDDYITTLKCTALTIHFKEFLIVEDIIINGNL